MRMERRIRGADGIKGHELSTSEDGARRSGNKNNGWRQSIRDYLNHSSSRSWPPPPGARRCYRRSLQRTVTSP
jgi:hypothetical protein